MPPINSGFGARVAAANSPRRRTHWLGFLFAKLTHAVEEDRRQRGEPPDLAEDAILSWAEAFFARTGGWPNLESGPIPEAPGETWLLVAAALALGIRGQARGRSLRHFFVEHRGRHSPASLPLSVDQILVWADAWRARTGGWPVRLSGKIPGAGRITWMIVDNSLQAGRGVLPSGSSLSEFLAKFRGVLRRTLRERQVLAWADAFHARTGRWPSDISGPVAEAPEESWREVDSALVEGDRGLRGGSSLWRLLAKKRGQRNGNDARMLTVAGILSWADAYQQRWGKWPDSESGRIPESPGEDWSDVQSALVWGGCGLEGGSSLGQLLAKERGLARKLRTTELTIPQILSWADTFHARTGEWPTKRSGPVEQAPGESWGGIHLTLTFGTRGLPRLGSLGRLLAQKRTMRHKRFLPRLTIAQILRWADAHRRRHGRWPESRSGAIPEAPGETWMNVYNALHFGRRGLPGGIALSQLLKAHHRAPIVRDAVPLTVAKILAWADAHCARTGTWPQPVPEPITESPGTTWRAVSYALRRGRRGLKGGSSLVRLLAEQRGVQRRSDRPRLTIPQILEWADAFHARTGRLPRSDSGPVAEAPGERWTAINRGLVGGYRGLPGKLTLARLLERERPIQTSAMRRPLTIADVMQWADAHWSRTGNWPHSKSGRIPESSGYTWGAVESVLRHGGRGIPGGSSLSRLRCQRHRAVDPYPGHDLAIPQILAWANAFQARTGRWPRANSGPIAEAPAESWSTTEHALRTGRRGLPGNMSLRGLREQERARQTLRRGGVQDRRGEGLLAN